MKSEFDEQARDWDEDLQRQARTRAVAEALRPHLGTGAGLRALELGCGTGALSFALLPLLGEVTLADNSAGMLEVLQEKIGQLGAGGRMRVLPLDLEHEAPPAAAFDLLYTQMTLHHLVDVPAALGRCHAALRPGGRLFIVDLDSEDGGFHGPEFTGHQGFERRELEQWARQAGFVQAEFSTVFIMHKGGREYPLFLAVLTRAT
ncbi:MAG: class I SAM-dependent methyltransferase [Candidatus Delongbacteria bacterium]